MLLIVGNNLGKSMALAFALSQKEIYAYAVVGQDWLSSYLYPKARVRPRRSRDTTSIDYYMDLFREEQEKDLPAEEPTVQPPALVLFMPDVREITAGAIMSVLKKESFPPRFIALCDEPSAYSSYMDDCDKSLFLSPVDVDAVTSELASTLLSWGYDLSHIRAGRLSLYLDEKDAYLYGKRLFLTPSEFRVLRFLAFHPGKLLSAEDIMAYCFPSTFLGKTANAVTHVCRINQKAAAACGEKPIKNKKGKGYYLPS